MEFFHQFLIRVNTCVNNKSTKITLAIAKELHTELYVDTK